MTLLRARRLFRVSALSAIALAGSLHAQDEGRRAFPDALLPLLGCYEVRIGAYAVGAPGPAAPGNMSPPVSFELDSRFGARRSETILWGVRDIVPPGSDSLVAFWSALGTDSIQIERRAGLAGSLARLEFRSGVLSGTQEVWTDAETSPRPQAIVRGGRITCPAPPLPFELTSWHRRLR